MKIQNLVHTTTYTKDGQQKKKYVTVGTLFTFDDGGQSIKLDAIPVGFDGKLAVYDREDKQQRPSQQTSGYREQPKPIGAPTVPGTTIPLETDIPFSGGQA